MLRPAVEYVHLETSPNVGTAYYWQVLEGFFLHIAHVDETKFPFSVSTSEVPSHSIGS